MLYEANPVRVEAHRIEKVQLPRKGRGYDLVLDNGQEVHATAEMCSRMDPKPGDYWVIQQDGYVYLNPKDVFERKYHAVVA